MRTKSAFGVIGALVPVVYCGGLLYYFVHTSGSIEDAETIGLGPTIAGLAVVGLLFCIPLLIRIVRILPGPRPPGPRSPGSGGGPDAPGHDDAGGFDGDAVIARYMAARPTDAAQASTAVPLARDNGGPAVRPTFGRKVR